MARRDEIGLCVDMRSDWEKYIDDLVYAHEEGEHEDKRRNCPDCETKVEYVDANNGAPLLRRVGDTKRQCQGRRANSKIHAGVGTGEGKKLLSGKKLDGVE